MSQDRPADGSGSARNSRETPQVRRRLLIEAATRCLEKGGIQTFTIERICREAGVSRGLINHYFAGKDDLLVAVYQAVLYETFTKHIAQVRAMPQGTSALDRLHALVNGCFMPDSFDRYSFPVWLALWGEIAKNPRLRAIRRDHYNSYRRHLAAEIASLAEARKLIVDVSALAGRFMALFDGPWLEWCQDEEVVGPQEACEACWDLLESKLGPLR